MDNSLEALLQEAVLEAMYYSYSASSKVKLVKTLQALIKHITPYTQLERDLFVTENQRQLSRLYSLLTEFSIKKNPEFISCKDRLFRNLLKFNPKAPLDIPKIFSEFVKGITYFSNEEDIKARPIYHRLYSCGERADELYDTLHRCTDDQSPTDRSIAEQRIYKCLLERMIFDDIYKHNTLFFPETGTEVHGQDSAHQQRLEKTYEDFKTCFPDMELKIKIEYSNVTPKVLTVIKKIRGRIKFVEVYKKDEIDNEAPVTCTLTKSSGVYIRINTFNIHGRLVKLKDHMH